MKPLLKGIPACPGKVKGKVKLIKTPASFVKPERGVIIVVPFTTPILALALSQAKAIVTDKGGLTSHAAVIAREFNIPCIVNTEKATKILKENQRIIVDGDKGEIYEAK